MLNSVARVAALGKHDAEAEDACARILRLVPRQAEIAAQWIDLRLRQCAWPVCAPLPALAEADLHQRASAAAMLCLDDDPPARLADQQSAYPALQRLRLLYEPHTRLHLLTGATYFKTLPAERINALAPLATARYPALAAGGATHNQAVQQTLREGYALPLAPLPAQAGYN